MDSTKLTDVTAQMDITHSKLARFLYDTHRNLYERLITIDTLTTRNQRPFSGLPGFRSRVLSHARNVIANLERLIPRAMPEPLTPFEIFAVLAAAYFHDTGMILSTQSGGKSSLRRKGSPKDHWDEMRIDLYNRSREFVVDNREYIKAENEKSGLSLHEARIIGEICRAHAMPNLTYLGNFEFSIKTHGIVRVPLLSALLRMADALDFVSPACPHSIDDRNVFKKGIRQSEIHHYVSDVRVVASPSWDICVFAHLDDDERHAELSLYELRNTIQRELDTVYAVFRAAGIFYKKIELILNRDSFAKSSKPQKNPFLLLRSFDSRQATLFAGRDRETQEMIEKILGQQLVLLLGESGVGKTSLVDAGVIPRLREYGYGVVRFSFQDDPASSLLAGIDDFARSKAERKHQTRTGKDVLKVIDGALSRTRGRIKRLLLVGDHLEKMFTVDKSEKARLKFVEQTSRILGNCNRATFLFCMRMDYLPDLHEFSQDIPDLFDRDNTYRLYRLSEENGRRALTRASAFASVKMSKSLIERVAHDLCYEGDGMIYPPYLQIVGYRLYSAWWKDYGGDYVSGEIPVSVYEGLGKMEAIVNNYLDGMLDRYTQDDKAMVAELLAKMVTEYYTKKRVKRQELQLALPQCHKLDRLLSGLVDNRIVRRTLDEYELMSDFLARKVIEFVEKKRFLSPPVRRAVDFITKNSQKPALTSGEIAGAADVSQMHLAVLFKNQLGTSINRQLNNARISQAKRLLTSSLEPISTIAERTGFKSQSNFSRKFRELEGWSPIEYRKVFTRRW